MYYSKHKLCIIIIIDQNKTRKEKTKAIYIFHNLYPKVSKFFLFFLLAYLYYFVKLYIFLNSFLVVCLLYYAVGIGSLSISFISLDLLDFLITVLLIVLALFMGSPLTTFSISSLVKVSYSNKPSANRFNSSLLSYNNFLVLFHYPTNNL